MRKVARILLLLSVSLLIMTAACTTNAPTVPAEPAIEENAPAADEDADSAPAADEDIDSAPEAEEDAESAPVEEDEPVEASESDEGARLVETRCTECHALSTVTNASYDQAGWEDNVARMIAYGARLNDAERVLVVQYLAENYGP